MKRKVKRWEQLEKDKIQSDRNNKMFEVLTVCANAPDLFSNGVMMINDKEEQSEIIDVHILPKLNDLNLLSVRKAFQDCLAIDVDESLTMNFNIEASYQLLKYYKEMQRYDAGKKTTYVNLYTLVTVPVFEKYSGAGKPKAVDAASRLSDSNEAIKEIERIKQNIIVAKETISGSRSHLYYKQSPGLLKVFEDELKFWEEVLHIYETVLPHDE